MADGYEIAALRAAEKLLHHNNIKYCIASLQSYSEITGKEPWAPRFKADHFLFRFLLSGRDRKRVFSDKYIFSSRINLLEYLIHNFRQSSGRDDDEIIREFCLDIFMKLVRYKSENISYLLMILDRLFKDYSIIEKQRGKRAIAMLSPSKISIGIKISSLRERKIEIEEALLEMSKLGTAREKFFLNLPGVSWQDDFFKDCDEYSRMLVKEIHITSRRLVDAQKEARERKSLIIVFLTVIFTIVLSEKIIGFILNGIGW